MCGIFMHTAKTPMRFGRSGVCKDCAESDHFNGGVIHSLNCKHLYLTSIA